MLESKMKGKKKEAAKKNLPLTQQEESGLSSFVERPVPTEKEVDEFERVIKRSERDQEIDSNLSAIYQDKKGQLVDAQKVRIRRRAPFILRLFRNLLILTVVSIAAYGAYLYWFDKGSDFSALEFRITAPEKVGAGEEFTYRLDYHNPTKYTLTQAHLELQYPENFLFSAATIAPISGNYGWDLPDLAPGGTVSLSITGRLVNQPDSVNVITGRLTYYPGSLTSQFKKEASASTLVSGPGFTADLEYTPMAFLAQDNEMTLILSDIQDNRLGDFNISFILPAEINATVVSGGEPTAKTATTTAAVPVAASSSQPVITKVNASSWQVSGLTKESGRQEIPLTYRVSKKIAGAAIIVRLEKKMTDGQSYIFWEKSFTPEIVASDLNLTLSLGGSKSDTAINFGDQLEYSLTYANLGESSYKDVIIMAALSGEFLDSSSLAAGSNGQISKQTVIWTKNEVPELAEIKPGQTGELKVSAKIRPFQEGDLGKNLSITAYGQYSVNGQSIKGENNRSNLITGIINSDLSLQEKILYFNSDNVPVGSGPLPPEAGQKTSFKVYWTIQNNLHELSEARVSFTLPSYVSWDEKRATNVGSIYYDTATRQVIWEIGRLPVSVYRADAEFGISLTPAESDRDKILVLSSGSVVSAMDTETKAVIIKRSAPKTTKLEDDDIASLNNSGQIK